MITFIGEPNHPVTAMKIVFGNRRRMVHLFSFDDKGRYTLDESKLSIETLKRLKSAFKWSEEVIAKNKTKKEVETDKKDQEFTKVNFMTLKKMAKDKGMKIEVNTKKKDILKYLGEVI